MDTTPGKTATPTPTESDCRGHHGPGLPGTCALCGEHRDTSPTSCPECEAAAGRRQAQFDKDRAGIEQALADGGWVVDLADGTQGISPDAPESLTRPYGGLMQWGYANGLVS